MLQRLAISIAVISLVVALPAMAQDVSGGRVASSTVGDAGLRRTKEVGVAGIKPMARIDNRIQNRIQSRIRNRIDRNYDPQANATSPFKVAGDQARSAGKPQGR